jgi:hypothetical protein
MLRSFLLLVLVSVCNCLSAQRSDWRSRIDRLVELADSLSMVSQQTFHINKFTSEDRPIRETWHYTVHNGRVIIFEVHYFLDSLEFQEVYYVNRDQLVCMEQYEILYPEQDEDRILKGAVGFFDGLSMRQYVTMGERSGRNEQLPSYEVISQFKDRYRELLTNRPLLEKKGKAVIFVP